MEQCDVLVIGGGPAGLAAAASARRNGAKKVLLLERDDSLGGILNQCIHDGFGLKKYKMQLTGPEYARRSAQEAIDAGVEFLTGCMVTDMTPEKVITAVSKEGLRKFSARTVIFATGCRERTRGSLSIPGPRPAGIFTAGVAQNLVNCKNIMVGRRIIILGSGDIGLIMARRLKLEGAEVLGVVEIMPVPGGLTRNVSQCVLDYDIPLYLSHTVSRIIGHKRLEAVEISQVDAGKHIIPDTARIIACDTLVLSVGLIPENEVAKSAGVELDRTSNSVVTDVYLQTNIPGVFSCGNSRNLMDFVDSVSQQGELAGKNAALLLQGHEMEPWTEQNRTQQLHGMPQPGCVICPLCPNGCEILLKKNGEIKGNGCQRGAAFAVKEQKCPERMLTTTVRLTNSSRPLLPVRSDKPVKKEDLLPLLEELRKMRVQAPVLPGQTLLSKNGVNIIAAREAR